VIGPDGKLTNRLAGKIFEDHSDVYAKDCRMLTAE
jgi:hypothetical protein